jgi:phosphoglycerate dehydrogenase-like enzyme
MDLSYRHSNYLGIVQQRPKRYIATHTFKENLPMPRARVVARMLPCLRAIRGRPISPEIEHRLEVALARDRIELVEEPDEEERLKAVEEAEFFLCENDHLGSKFYRRARRLRLILAGGYFFERLNPEEAALNGIPVATFPMPITDSVADHTIAMLLHLKRNFLEAVRVMREESEKPASPIRPDGSAYNWTQLTGIKPLRGLRLGILGLGDIGRGISMRARAFGMEVRYWNRTPLPPWLGEKVGASPMQKEELCEWSEVLLIGVGLNDQTRGMVGEKEIRSMPPGGIILNIGRGPIVDHGALYDALSDGHLGGAGLDVFDPEPFPTDHPLLQLPNVVPTPHCAGGDDENLVSEVELFFSNIHRVLDGKSPIGIANGVPWRG